MHRKRCAQGSTGKSRLTLAGRYFPNGPLPTDSLTTRKRTAYATGRLNEREARLSPGRRSAFASLLPPLNEVDVQDFGGLTNFAEERYDQNG